MPNLDRDYYLDKAGLAQFVNEFETNIVAEEFSTSATYNLGDYCIYDNLLYLCTTAVTTAGSWTGSTNWLQVLIGDELSEKTEIKSITLAQWNALSPDEKASGDYVITDQTLAQLTAGLIPYDNTTSGLTADDVQEAIDELAQGSASSMAQLTDVKLTTPQNGQELVYDNTLTSPYKWENRTTRVELTQAQYDALTNPLPNVDYYITDAPSMSGSSRDLSYDGTTLSTYNKIESLTASDIEYSSGVTVADRFNISARFYVAPIDNLTVTANSALSLGTVSDLSGGRIATRYQCKGISVISGAGTNYSFLGAIVIGANDNVVIYPFRSDTNVSIRIGFLY